MTPVQDVASAPGRASTEAGPNDATPAARSVWPTVLAIIAATALVQVAVGLNAVVFPVVLKDSVVRQIEVMEFGVRVLQDSRYLRTLIGACLAMEVFAVLVVSRYIPRIIERVGLGRVVVLATTIRLVSILTLSASRSLPVWFAGVFAFGMGTSLMIIAIMTWLNSLHFPRFRGAVTGVFSSSLSLGTATGPVIANLVGVADGQALFRIDAWIVAASVVPLLLVLRRAPVLERQPRPRIAFALRMARPAMLSALVGGITFFGLPAFLTLFGMMNGLSIEQAALLITMFMAGSVLIGPLLSTLSAYVDASHVIVSCVFVGLLCASYLPLAIYDYNPQALLLLFIWGGVAGGIYATGLAAVGEIFRPEDQVSANVAYSLMDSLGGVIGVFLIGASMDAFGSEGLTYVVVTAAIGYFIYSLSCYEIA